MTIDYLKDLLFDAVNEYPALALRDLRWNRERQALELTLEDGSRFLLSVEELSGPLSSSGE